MSKYDFCISGLMNARLSVHSTLKRAKCRNYRLCTLTSSLKRIGTLGSTLGNTLKRATSVQHFLKMFLWSRNVVRGPFLAIFY